jgi:hypothetical protein
VLVATVAHSSLNAFALVSANIPPADALWFIFAGGCLVVVVLIVIDRRVWFARPVEMKSSVAVPSAA